jgi:hypothetical protein
MHSTRLLVFVLSAMLQLVGEVAAQSSAAEARIGRISGRVLDALGMGVVAARVTVFGDREEREVLARTVCDADGMFVCPKLALPARGWLWVRAEAEGRCPDTAVAHLTEAAPESFEILRLWDAGTLSIRVIDESGRALPAVAVIAEAHDSRILGPESSGRGTTDAEGKLTAHAVPIGAVDVRALRKGYRPHTETIWLGDHADLEIVLFAGDGVDLAVRVDGLPAGVEASIRVSPYASGSYVTLPGVDSVQTTVGGALRLTSLPDYDYRVSVHCEGYFATPSVVRLPAGKADREAVFAMQRRGTQALQLTLRDPDDNALAGERVRVRAQNLATVAEGRTDDEGRLALDVPLGAGETIFFELISEQWTLTQEKTAQTHGSFDARFLGRHEYALGPNLECALRAIPAVTITGRVVDAKGAPVRGRLVELQETRPNRNPVWMMLRQTTTLADGGFQFHGTYPLELGVRLALDAQGTVSSAEFDLRNQTRIEGIVLTAIPRCTIDGRVRDELGQPIAGARVWLRNWDPVSGHQIDSSVLEVLTDREGRYRFFDVDAGGHRIEVYGVNDQPWAIRPAFHLEAGSTATHDFEVQR